MPLFVSGPIVHPRANAWFRFNPTAPYCDCGQDVVYLVQGLDSSFAFAPARSLASALAAYGIPKAGSLAPAPEQSKYGAVALDYDSEVIPQSTDAVYIIVKYRTPIPRANGGGPALFAIEDDCVLSNEETSLHPATKTPMTIEYNDPKDANNSNNVLATFGYTRPLRKLVISGYIAGKDLDDVRDSFGFVNENKWFGKPRGYWKFEEFRTDGTLLGNVWKVTAGFTTRVNEDWSEYEVFYNETLGQFVEVKQKDIDELRKLPYVYGWTTRNGITKAGLSDTTDFVKLFGIGGSGNKDSGGIGGNDAGHIATNG